MERTAQKGQQDEAREEQPAGLDAGLQDALPALYRFARALSRGRGAIDPEDLVQEAAARALRARGAARPGVDPLPWLRKILLRIYLDARARLVSEPGRLGEEPSTSAAAGPDGVDSRDWLARVLLGLGSVEREALLRFHQRGESIDEIARALELPTGTIKSHLHRARAKLARRLKARSHRDE